MIRAPTLRAALALLAPLVAAPAARAATAIPGTEPIRMPPLLVAARDVPWRYAQFPGFEILSRCPDAVTTNFIHGLVTAETLVRILIPSEFQAEFDSPHIIILSENDLVSNVSRELITDPRGVIAAGFQPKKVELMSNLETVDRDRRVTFALLDRKPIDPERVILAPAHVRSILEYRVPSLPGWVVGGMLRLYADDNAGFYGDAIVLPPFDIQHALMPIGAMFSGPATVERNEQAALFIRWAMHDAESPERRSAFWRFVDYASREPISEKSFQASFRKTYAEMDFELAQYAQQKARGSLRFRLVSPPKLPAPKIANATTEQIARLKGEWEVLAMDYVVRRFPEYTQAYWQQAAGTLELEYSRGNDDPRFAALFGIFYCELENDAKALPFLQAAAEGKVARPRVYYELARIRLAEARLQAVFNNNRISVEDTAKVIEPLQAAAHLLPPLREAFQLATDTLGQGQPELTAGQQSLLATGVRNYPLDADLIFRTARVLAQYGLKSDAIRLAERAAYVSQSNEERQRINDFRGSLRTIP